MLIRVQRKTGDIMVTATAQRLGADVAVCIYGGDSPHIGAVALAQPYESLKKDGSLSASCSVITVPAHKEDALAKESAVFLAKTLGAVVTVSCGVHVEGAKAADIAAVLSLCAQLRDELAQLLQQQL